LLNIFKYQTQRAGFIKDKFYYIIAIDSETIFSIIVLAGKISFKAPEA